MMQTVSSLLCEPIPFHDPILKITLNITINRDGNYAFSKYSNEKGDFISVNVSPRIVFRYIIKGAEWDRHHQIIINQMNIFQLRLGFKKFYHNFQKEDLYRYDRLGNLVELLADTNDALVISLSMGQLMRLEPTVITDEKNKAYPGILMVINREENRVPLSVEEFEAIYELIMSINIYQAGMTLLQTYIGMKKVSIETTMDLLESRGVPKSNPLGISKSLFDRDDRYEDEGSVSGIIKPKQPTTLEDLDNMKI